MELIPLGRDVSATVDSDDYDRISQFKWRFFKSKSGCLYPHRRFNGSTWEPTCKFTNVIKTAKYTTVSGEVRMYKRVEKMVMLYWFVLGYKGSDEIDHVNGNPLDCRKENLRVCTHAENMRNRKMNKNNTTGYRGVEMRRKNGMFRAKIRKDGKNIHLGHYLTAIEASEAYEDAAKRLFGTFLRKSS